MVISNFLVDICPSGYQAGGDDCIPCVIGEYRDETADQVCTACPAGRMTATNASISVDNCTVGKS